MQWFSTGAILPLQPNRGNLIHLVVLSVGGVGGLPAGDVHLNILQLTGSPPSPIKSYLVSHVNNVKAKKPWYRGIPYYQNLETEKTYLYFPDVHIRILATHSLKFSNQTVSDNEIISQYTTLTINSVPNIYTTENTCI